MNAVLARMVMVLAIRCLCRDRAEWTRAMRAEFDAAVDDRRPLGFAFGCLAMAWRELPKHAEGRLTLTSHAVALGLILPFATFHLGCTISGLRFLLAGHDHYYTVLAAGDAPSHQLASAYRAAAPLLTGALLVLGMGHVLIAWAMLDRRWRRVAVLWAIVAVAAMILAGFAVMLFPSQRAIGLPIAALGIELAAIPALARWQARLGSTSLSIGDHQ